MKIRIQRPRRRFKRHCRVCDEKFVPTGRYSELCDICFKKQRRGIKVEKRIHKAWAERESAKKRGLKIRRLMGKWHYIYKSRRGEVSLIQTTPGLQGKMIWELMVLNKKDQDTERFTTKKDAYERIRELIG